MKNYFSISDCDSHDTIIDLVTDWNDPTAQAILETCERNGNSNYYVTEWEPATEDYAEEPVQTINLDEFRSIRII